ncbi:MAG: DUF3179 domain-containing protein [Planctomycetota bacterium]|nr:MAG: DUF3179 domain-containing protein [Planctomycetota bacterium]
MDFRSGGWVLVLTGVVVLGIAAWRVLAILPTLDHRAHGDGVHLESYGFDLSNLLVPRERLYPIGPGMPKDGLPAMNHPATIAASELPADRKLLRIRKMTTTTRVIGVEIDGEARAYPLWVLNWHEIANDTLGGTPILVTYNGICDSAVVFERRVRGREAEFGFSGLLYNGNLVFYDRRDDPHDESLWCQLQFRAIAGPAAADKLSLRVLPCELTEWGAWVARRPQTTIVLPDPSRARIYKRDPYSTYFASDEIKFPTEPLPPENGPLRRKDRVVAVQDAQEDRWEVMPAAEFAATPAPKRPTVFAFWFAWYAHHPDSRP